MDFKHYIILKLKYNYKIFLKLKKSDKNLNDNIYWTLCVIWLESKEKKNEKWNKEKEYSCLICTYASISRFIFFTSWHKHIYIQAYVCISHIIKTIQPTSTFFSFYSHQSKHLRFAGMTNWNAIPADPGRLRPVFRYERTSSRIHRPYRGPGNYEGKYLIDLQVTFTSQWN